MANPWEKYHDKQEHLAHQPSLQQQMQRRRRHRFVRYWLFRFQSVEEKLAAGEEGVELFEVEKMPGFLEFWLEQKPVYQINPGGKKEPVDPKRDRPVSELGGYGEFGSLWDVDENLDVYLRHSSVWQAWDAKLRQMTPVLALRPR